MEEHSVQTAPPHEKQVTSRRPSPGSRCRLAGTSHEPLLTMQALAAIVFLSSGRAPSLQQPCTTRQAIRLVVPLQDPPAPVRQEPSDKSRQTWHDPTMTISTVPPSADTARADLHDLFVVEQCARLPRTSRLRPGRRLGIVAQAQADREVLSAVMRTCLAVGVDPTDRYGPLAGMVFKPVFSRLGASQTTFGAALEISRASTYALAAALRHNA